MTWSDRILNEFAPDVALLTIVTDADQIMTAPTVQKALAKRGFEWLPYENEMAFRFLFESKYRYAQEQTYPLNLVVALPGNKSALDAFPYDLLRISHTINLSLQDLFPKLQYGVLKLLDPSNLDVLDQATDHFPKIPIGEKETKTFVLRHVFDVALDLIKTPADLLQNLLKIHYQGVAMPEVINSHLIRSLRQKEAFQKWPLESIVTNRDAFFQFLQDRWPVFLKRQIGGNNVSETLALYTVTSPAELPFDHDNIRVYIDNLFLEGFLQPIPLKQLGLTSKELPADRWLRVGLEIAPKEDRNERLERLIQLLQTEIPEPNAYYQDWLIFAPKWAELNFLWHQVSEQQKEKVKIGFQSLQSDIDRYFLEWVETMYGSLYSQIAKIPAMLHQVPRYLARTLEQNATKRLALVVIDGMALDQWVALKQVLAQQMPQTSFRESSVFAWLPTLTSVSRQALFSGSLPMQFANSLQATTKEASLWQKFWLESGLLPNQISYGKVSGSANSLDKATELLANKKVRALGLVVNQVDNIMHGMTLGTAGMHNQVNQWGKQGFMRDLLVLLRDESFTVVITADHGNIEAVGIGQPKEGAIAEIRGERVRVYPDDQLRSAVLTQYPSSIEWPSIGLPSDYVPLFAPNRKAFAPSGTSVVCHGGISIEELIVPFIQIEPACK